MFADEPIVRRTLPRLSWTFPCAGTGKHTRSQAGRISRFETAGRDAEAGWTEKPRRLSWGRVMDRQALERLDDARLATWDEHEPDAFVQFFADDFVIRDTAIEAPITTKDGRESTCGRGWPPFRISEFAAPTASLTIELIAGEVEMFGTNTSSWGWVA